MSRDTRAQNITSVSWGDHIEWGAGDAHLSTPDEIARSRLDLPDGAVLGAR